MTISASCRKGRATSRASFRMSLRFGRANRSGVIALANPTKPGLPLRSSS